MYCKRLCIVAVAVVGLMFVLTRLALAEGDLSVSLADGVLLIVGDKKPNDIIVSEYDELILVGGCDWEYNRSYFPWFPYWLDYSPSGGRTTVNGGDPIFFAASEVSEIIVIAGGGPDWLLIQGSLGGDLSIDCGR